MFCGKGYCIPISMNLVCLRKLNCVINKLAYGILQLLYPSLLVNTTHPPTPYPSKEKKEKLPPPMCTHIERHTNTDLFKYKTIISLVFEISIMENYYARAQSQSLFILKFCDGKSPASR